MLPSTVDDYLRDGCGRCEHYKTKACKVHRWTEALEALRAIVLGTGLQETVKWGSPCYTLQGKNVVMIVSFKEFCALQFFRGASLQDPQGLLESPGPNSRFSRWLKFRSGDEVLRRRAKAKAFLEQAIALEGAAQAAPKVARIPAEEPVPEELARRLAKDSALRKAFAALTPGRRRSHILYIAGAKQSSTRETRVDRVAPVILAGRGFNER